MKKFLTKKATMIGSIVAAAVVFVLLLAFCVRPVSVGYTYSGELEMGGAKYTTKAHIHSFNQMTLAVYDEDGEKVKDESGKFWYVEKDGYIIPCGNVETIDKEEFKEAKEELNKQWDDLKEHADKFGYKVNAFKVKVMGEEFTCGGAYATVVVLAVVDAVLVAGAVASVLLRKKK